MRKPIKPIWISAALLAISAPLCALAQQQAPPPPPPQDSVAEAARKAREEKKNPPKSAKVYTNENIPYDSHINVVGTLPASLTTPAPDTTKPGAQPAKSDSSASSAPKVEVKDEAYWRKRFADEHKKLDMAAKELDIMQRELNLLQTQYYSDPTKAMNEQFNRKDINDKTAAIEKKKTEIAAIKQEIDDLETEMKRAGGDPGWAR
jgi:hypothetical protein